MCPSHSLVVLCTRQRHKCTQVPPTQPVLTVPTPPHTTLPLPHSKQLVLCVFLVLGELNPGCQVMQAGTLSLNAIPKSLYVGVCL